MDVKNEDGQPDLFGAIIRELQQDQEHTQPDAGKAQEQREHSGLSAGTDSGTSVLPGKESFSERLSFTGVHTEGVSLYDASYTDCTFTNCSIKKTDLTNATFTGCSFVNCELVLCKIDGTAIDCTRFVSCRLTGMNFTEVSEYGFGPDFSECMLDSCVFYDNTLNKDRFLNSTLRNTDFTNCRMKNTDFSGSRFQSVTVLGCNLEGADFRSASGYSIDPSANKLKGARFSLPEAASFLKYIGVSLE